MWTRAELKDRAKFAFKRNYWRSVLISLLLALLIGGGRKCRFGYVISFRK